MVVVVVEFRAGSNLFEARGGEKILFLSQLPRVIGDRGRPGVTTKKENDGQDYRRL